MVIFSEFSQGYKGKLRACLHIPNPSPSPTPSPSMYANGDGPS